MTRISSKLLECGSKESVLSHLLHNNISRHQHGFLKIMQIYINPILLECNLHAVHTIRLLDKLLEKLSLQQLHSVNTTCDSSTDSLYNSLP